MFLYKGEQKVGKGTYWDLYTGHRVDVDHEAFLPGDRKTAYLRISPIIMLLLAPFLGLLYYIFFPVATVLIACMLMVQKVLRSVWGGVRRLSYFEWRPSEAYLSGKKRNKVDDTREHDTSDPG